MLSELGVEGICFLGYEGMGRSDYYPYLGRVYIWVGYWLLSK